MAAALGVILINNPSPMIRPRPYGLPLIKSFGMVSIHALDIGLVLRYHRVPLLTEPLILPLFDIGECSRCSLQHAATADAAATAAATLLIFLILPKIMAHSAVVELATPQKLPRRLILLLINRMHLLSLLSINL